MNHERIFFMSYHKKHLPPILVWQEEKAKNGCVGNLVVKCFTMKLQESRVECDIVATSKDNIIAIWLGFVLTKMQILKVTHTHTLPSPYCLLRPHPSAHNLLHKIQYE